jgi:hypothetical protein
MIARLEAHCGTCPGLLSEVETKVQGPSICRMLGFHVRGGEGWMGRRDDGYAQ